MRSGNISSRRLRIVVLVVAAITCPALLAIAQNADAGDAGTVAVEGEATADRDIVFYYFHGDRRCNTCRKIESFAKQAIEERFAEELESGELRWKVVNTDEAANAHFVKDFGLVSSSLVVVEMNGDRAARHDVLHDAWTLVRDEAKFVQYVQRSVHRYLK